VLYAGLIQRPDVLHIQAIGPAIMTPLARLLGLRVVVTHHGPDYDRQKWGRFAKFVLQIGEQLGMRWANKRIVISKVIQGIVWDKQEQDSVLIPNGVVLPELTSSIENLIPFGLTPGRYIILVSRLVPEKRHMDLIQAFQQTDLVGWKLAIVGSADHSDGYTRQVLEAAAKARGVVCTGFQSGKELSELYVHAGFFVLPSSHEGLPIALLEALSYGLPVVASDIPANLEVGLPAENYFPLGDIDALAEKLHKFAITPLTQEAREIRRTWVSARFDWKDIARQTMAVYREGASGKIR
jgi:glycosyltransferase involved in cell wall biosynthesis